MQGENTMNRRNVLSPSAIVASKDAGRDGLFGLSAVSLHRLSLVVPALCALAYPSLLSLLSSGLVLVHGSTSPDGAIVWGSVIASLTLALAVMLVSFVCGLALGSTDANNPDACHARSIAHLAFATPSLYVGFNNVAGVLHAPSAVPIAWLAFWALAATIVLSTPRSSPMAAAMTLVGHRRLVLAHGVSACAILLLFVGPHIVNHVAGFWSGPIHIAVMNAVRRVYRDDIVQPMLLGLIGFQILSGTALVRRRIGMPSDLLDTLQTMSGVYVGVYFLAHMTAVFAARYTGTDTNWNWLTRPHDSMLVSLSSLRLIAHYWVGPIAIVAHVACGLRMVLLQRDISLAAANRLVLALIAVGVVASSVIVVALLNVHIA
jgi:succinate dehydrogenase/fumarate reductase cytochrome b subunit